MMLRNRSFLFSLGVIALASAAQAGVISYEAVMTGPRESPPNASPAIGFAQLDIDTTAHTVRYRATFTGLLGPTTVAHVHAPTTMPFNLTAGVATQQPSFPGWPVGVLAGSYDMTFNTLDAASWNPAYITNHGGGTLLGTEAAFATHLAEGRAYFNVHTSAFTGGEIRGFFVPVPSPNAAVLLALGALAATRRRRHS